MGRRDGTWKLRPESRFFDRQLGEEGMWTQRTISATEDHVRGRIGRWQRKPNDPSQSGLTANLSPGLTVVVASAVCFLIGIVVGVAIF